MKVLKSLNNLVSLLPDSLSPEKNKTTKTKFRQQNTSKEEEIYGLIPNSYIDLPPVPNISELPTEQIDIEVTYSYNTKYAGKSEVNGNYAIVDVLERNRLYRRLIFCSDNTFIQSESILKGEIETDYLVPYHRVMIDSLRHLYGGITRAFSAELSFCVLGLGGGLLTKFLYEKFPLSKVITVEIDPQMVIIAKKFFNLPDENERLRLVVDDALHFFRHSAQNERFDVIFCDLAGDNSTEKLVFSPPSQFVTKTVLQDMKDCLTEKGLLLMNFVARDLNTKNEIKNVMAEVFPKILSGAYKKDISEIVICPLHKIPKTEQMLTKRWKMKKEEIGYSTINKQKLNLKSIKKNGKFK